jgi:histidine ammonia-lyase
LIHGERNLPAFLSPNPGLNSGFMILQYSAAALVSQCKQGASPASVDTIDSSRGQEDHVSMGANAALQAQEQIQRVWTILGMEWFAACQALDFHLPAISSSQIEALRTKFRLEVPFLEQDAEMYPYIQASVNYIRNHAHAEVG